MKRGSHPGGGRGRSALPRAFITVVSVVILSVNLCGSGSAAAAATGIKEGKKAKSVSVPVVPGYLIGPEDILEISVWKNPDLSKVVTVRPDGRITLPLVGDVMASGRTPDQLRDRIVEKIKEYQDNVVVSVILQEINSYKIFMLGAIARPGSYVMKRKTTLLQAIALAGGFNQYASKNKIVVIRERHAGDKREEKIRVSFDDAVDVQDGGGQNLVLRPGDTIFVP